MDGRESEFEDTTAMNREHYIDTGYVYAAISVYGMLGILTRMVDRHP